MFKISQGNALCTKHCHCVNCFNVGNDYVNDNDSENSEKTICLMNLPTENEPEQVYRYFQDRFMNIIEIM